MKIKRMPYLFVILNICMMSVGGRAFPQNTTTDKYAPIKVTEGIYRIKNFGCNIAVMIGDDGVLIIDSGDQAAAVKTDSVIKTISNKPVRYVLNTHFHFDHVGGNKKLSGNDAVIVAQENTRQRMMTEWNVPTVAGVTYPVIPPYSEDYLPKICFQNSINIYFNNDTIQGIHFLNGHSDSDVIYFFRKANVIHTGDLFLSNGFPIIDIYNGGSIDGYLRAVDNIISLCNERTIVIPGHGATSDRQGLVDYRNMLSTAKTNIEKMIKEGKTLEQVTASDPTKDLFKGGKSWLPASIFIDVVYKELSKK